MGQGDEKTVLVIEDDTNTAALVALYLEREGFRPVTTGAPLIIFPQSLHCLYTAFKALPYLLFREKTGAGLSLDLRPLT